MVLRKVISENTADSEQHSPEIEKKCEILVFELFICD